MHWLPYQRKKMSWLKLQVNKASYKADIKKLRQEDGRLNLEDIISITQYHKAQLITLLKKEEMR